MKMSPLHYSVFFGHVGCINALIEAGADKEKQLVYIDDIGTTLKSYTLLELSVLSNQYSSAKMLLEKGVPIDHLDLKLETVLHKATRGLKLDLITLFVEWKDPKNKIDLNKFTLKFESPLTYAIRFHISDKKALIESGDPISKKQLEVIEYLLSKGAKVQYSEKDIPSTTDLTQFDYNISGGTNKKSKALHSFHQPLILAVKLGSPSLVKLLLHKGADVNVLTCNENYEKPTTPLDLIYDWLEEREKEDKEEKKRNQDDYLKALKKSLTSATDTIRFLDRIMEIYQIEKDNNPVIEVPKRKNILKKKR